MSYINKLVRPSQITYKNGSINNPEEPDRQYVPQQQNIYGSNGFDTEPINSNIAFVPVSKKNKTNHSRPLSNNYSNSDSNDYSSDIAPQYSYPLQSNRHQYRHSVPSKNSTNSINQYHSSSSSSILFSLNNNHFHEDSKHEKNEIERRESDEDIRRDDDPFYGLIHQTSPVPNNLMSFVSVTKPVHQANKLNYGSCEKCNSSFQDRDSRTSFPCGHSFHFACCYSHVLQTNKCPTCDMDYSIYKKRYL